MYNCSHIRSTPAKSLGMTAKPLPGESVAVVINVGGGRGGGGLEQRSASGRREGGVMTGKDADRGGREGEKGERDGK